MRRSSYLQIMALVSMAIDHIGAVLFPQTLMLRIIGRAALPIFCFQLARGSASTRSKKSYFLRVFNLAAVSQIPYVLALSQPWRLNICFGLAISMLVLFLLEQEKYWPALALSSGLSIGSFEYGSLPLALAIGFKYIEDRYTLILYQLVVLSIFAYSTGMILQILAVLGVLITFIPHINNKLKFSRWAAYLFYPFHLSIIYIIKWGF